MLPKTAGIQAQEFKIYPFGAVVSANFKPSKISTQPARAENPQYDLKKQHLQQLRASSPQSSSWLSWYGVTLVSLTDCRWWFDSLLVRE
jgi:hypothetical protein